MAAGSADHRQGEGTDVAGEIDQQSDVPGRLGVADHNRILLEGRVELLPVLVIARIPSPDQLELRFTLQADRGFARDLRLLKYFVRQLRPALNLGFLRD